jgi:hypothetical protein
MLLRRYERRDARIQGIYGRPIPRSVEDPKKNSSAGFGGLFLGDLRGSIRGGAVYGPIYGTSLLYYIATIPSRP